MVRNNYPEKVIVRHILKYLGAIGAYSGKVKTMGVQRGRVFCFDPYLMRGMPDILCFHKKRLYFIEVKSGRNKQSPEQATFQEHCQSSAVPYILAYSVEDVQAIIQ